MEQLINKGNLTKKDMEMIKARTQQLFMVMAMCEDEDSRNVCRNEIVELNIRLVTHVLKKYKPFGEDEFQMGCVGLINATMTFKAERGVPFSSYACFCIERELHKAHRAYTNSFEGQAGYTLSSLDDVINLGNGDEINRHETIADNLSEEVFEKILEDFDLENLFDNIVLPAIAQVAKGSKGQNTVVNFDIWRTLELRYLLEMAEVDSQKARVTLSAIAKELGVSVQNIRMRHNRVIETIKSMCIVGGLWV